MEQSSASSSSSIDVTADWVVALPQNEQEKIRRFQENDPTLTELGLGWNSIGDEGGTAIGKALETNATLTRLYLNSNSIGDEGAAAIGKALEKNKTLKGLYLGWTSIGDKGATAIGNALETNKTLTELNLDSNSIGDEGAVAFGKALETNKALTVLYLYKNSIGDKGAVAIGKALETNQTLASNLQRLDLSNNDITRLPRSFVKLEGTCKYFNVDGNPLLEPPPEVAERGLGAIARYFEAVDKGEATTSRQLKTVLVGDGEAGKTSLRNAIAGRFPARTEGEEERTIYLNVEPVQIYAPEGYSDDPITLMVYDCGGQQDYAVGQAPFMTESSLFLLVVAADKAHDDCYEDVVHRFLVLLQARAPGAVVQLVLSKVDLVPDELDEAERKQWLEERVRWLNDKVQGQLQAWRNAAAIREREQVALQDRVIAEDDSMERKKPPLLRILPNVLEVSVTSRSAIARSQAQVSNTIFRHTQDHAEPRLSSVGTLIPKSWQELWKFFGAVLQCGTDANEETIFSVASSDDAIPLGEIGNIKTTTDGGEADVSAKGPYSSVARLKSLWNKFRFLHAPLADDTTFGDALGLLEARGSIFVDAGLAYLQPSFVTDLIKPLIDHTLTLERINAQAFKRTVGMFLKGIVARPTGLRNPIIDGLKKLTKKGELDPAILPFLWHDLVNDYQDFPMILQMLLDADVIFGSSLDESLGGLKPVVLFRQRKEVQPEELQKAWPILSDDEQQQELRLKMWEGCPPSLAAHFAAATHAHGKCICAWLYGAIVLDENTNRRLRSEIVEMEGEAWLVFTARGARVDRDMWRLLQGAVEFVIAERNDHFPGLDFDCVLACARCIKLGRAVDECHEFDWSEVAEERTTDSLVCDICKEVVQVGRVFHTGDGTFHESKKARKDEMLDKMMERLNHLYMAKDIPEDAKPNEAKHESNSSLQSPLDGTGYTARTVAPQITAGGRNVSSLYTQARLDGIETDVGELSMAGIPDPSSVWQVNLGGDPYVFLSHRGIDTKETIARPTHWFLARRLGVKTFMDDGSLKTGEDQMRSLLEAAHTCTHAVIILSPNFRESRYCVMELNTFMMRRERSFLKVFPYLWKLDKDDKFATSLKRMIYLEARIDDPARYLVGRLWPDLIERLKCDRDKPEWDELSLKDELVRYVEEHRVDETTPPIPKSLEAYANAQNIGSSGI